MKKSYLWVVKTNNLGCNPLKGRKLFSVNEVNVLINNKKRLDVEICKTVLRVTELTQATLFIITVPQKSIVSLYVVCITN